LFDETSYLGDKKGRMVEGKYCFDEIGGRADAFGEAIQKGFFNTNLFDL